MANSVDPDQTPLFAASDLGLHCLQKPLPILRVITVNGHDDQQLLYLLQESALDNF